MKGQEARGTSARPRPEESLQELMRFERVLSALTVDLIDLPPADIEAAIHGSLQRIVEALQIDRCTLARVYPLTGCMEVTHSFAVEGFKPMPKSTPSRSDYPWFLSRSLRNIPSSFERVDDLPPEANIDKASFRRDGTLSHVTMPIMVAGELQAVLGFGSLRCERAWSESLLVRMRLLTHVFGSALSRKQAQEELEVAIGFERLASNVLASLGTRRGEEAPAIAAGLHQIGEFVGVERVILWERVQGQNRFTPSKQWNAPGFESAPDVDVASAGSWIEARIADGEAVRLARIAELPPVADEDAAALKAAGIRSLLMVPIAVSGRIAAALSMASMQREHEWPKVLMPGISLLAEVFATLHAREVAERRKFAAEVEATRWQERMAQLVRIHTVGEMSVALAHEIAQPLGAIGNYAIAARRRVNDVVLDRPHLIELIDKVVRQSVRAGEVVTRMRTMAQRHDLEAKTIDIGATILECVGIAKMDCERRSIRIDLSVANDLPLVSADEFHVQQVALNLMRNAMEAIESAGPDGARKIDVGVRLDERGDVLVEVSDSGSGIAEGDTERVFESFYTTKTSGIGVGLAICRKLIEAHGGKLWASHRPGKGAVFQFTLPH